MNIVSNEWWLSGDAHGRRAVTYPAGVVHDIQHDYHDTRIGLRYREDPTVDHPNTVFEYVEEPDGTITINQIDPHADPSDYYVCIWGGKRNFWFRLRAIWKYDYYELVAWYRAFSKSRDYWWATSK